MRERKSVKPNFESNAVKKKKGSSEGNTTIAQSFIPFSELAKYFCGFKIIKVKKRHTDKIINSLKIFFILKLILQTTKI